MRRLVKVISALSAGTALLSMQACTPEEWLAVQQATGLSGTVEEVNAGCEASHGPGSADPGGACYEIGIDLINRATRQAEPAGQITNESRWDRIAACESGGRWDYPPVTNRTGTYSGGLMIGHRWWPLYDGREFAQWPYQASKAQQITVAERIWADNGSSAWDCK